MSALAKLLLCMGKSVYGCDRVRNEYVIELQLKGVGITFTADDNKIDACDVVVYTDAVKEDDLHIRRAVKNNKALLSRGQLLAAVSRCFNFTIAIAGCHGKTTCTSMLAHIFACADKQFSAHIGGNDLSFGNCRVAGYDYFITEACEYGKNFLFLNPDIGVILNSDIDHLECYSGEDDLINSYTRFADNSEKCICLHNDRCRCGEVTFGLDETADFSAKKIKSDKGKYSFDIYERGRKICSVSLNVYGRHNIFNALAAAATARLSGIMAEPIEKGLNRFSGVARRFEKLGKVNGCDVIADYAHHPREIKAVLRTATEVTDNEIYVIFQPHTYSRTKNLFDDFVACLSGIDHLLIYKTFAAREYFDAEGSALTLANAIDNCIYAECPQDIKYYLRDIKQSDKIFVLGAGDIYNIVREILN